MKGLKTLLFFLFILISHALPSFADTTVGGVISTDTTWTLAGSPYNVTSTVQVYGTSTTAATLTIEPGVVVKFASNTVLQIGSGASQGALIARGTTTERITFTRSGTTGTWGTIAFQDGTVDAITVIENADVQYNSGLSITSASPTIKTSTITDVTGYGINLSSANPIMENVAITNNGSYGLYLSNSSPIITGGSLTNTSTTGHGIYGSGSPTISNYSVSIVNSAGKYGLYLGSTTSALSVTNSIIANGIYFGSTGITPTITGNTFTNLDNSPLHAGANIIAQIIANNTLTGQTFAGKIEVVGEQINRDTLWWKQIAPYVISGAIYVYKDTISPATLTIEPGTAIKFAGGSGLYIGSGASQGALIARGTTTERIIFTRSGTTGTWAGLTYYDGTVDATSVIENADIQYTTGFSINSASPVFRNCTITDMTGYASFSNSNPVLENVTLTNNGSYGIYLNSSSPIITGGSLTNTNTTGQGIYGNGAPVITNYNVSMVNSTGKYGLYLNSSTSMLSVTNSTIANGIYLASTGITPTVTGNTFTNLDNSPLHAGANIIAQIIANNTLTGLASTGRVEVMGEQVSQDTTWNKLVAPYWVVSGTVSVYNTTAIPSTLTIAPGTMIKFAPNTGLQIGNGTSQGALIARGTTTERITFTRSSTTGTWGTIAFQDGTVDAITVIENADVQYNSGLSITSASPTIKTSTITDVTGYGINLSSANPIMENVAITNNGSYGLYLSNSSPIITGGSLTNTSTTGHGIYGSGSPTISNYSVSIVNSAGKYGLYLGSTTSALSVTNSIIANGIYFGSTGITPTITGNTFTNLDNSPLHAGANIIAQIIANNTLTGQTFAGKIEVVGEQINRDTLWRKQIAPYVISGAIYVYKDTISPATLTIEPGTTIKLFAGGSGLYIGSGANQGALIAKGTTTERITFTRSGTSGTWAGLTYYDGAVDATSVIENADIQYTTGFSINSASPVFRNCTITDMTGYASFSNSNPVLENVTLTNNGSYGINLSASSPIITGGSLTNTNTNTTGHGIYGNGAPVITNYNVSMVNSTGKYGLYLNSSTSMLSVTNSTIANGIYLASTGITPTVTGNTFTNLDSSPIHVGANIVGQLIANNALTGLTSGGRIEIVGEQVNRNVTWSPLAAPYHVVSGTVSVYNTTTTASTLTIAPGTVIKFATSTGLQIGSGTNQGALIAQGTPSNRITFTRSGISGTWAGLTYYDGTVDATSVIEIADIQYTTGFSINSASPVFRNCTITDMTGYASFSNSNPVLENVTLTNNGSYGINLSASSPIITGGSLTNTNTTGHGIYGSGSPTVSNYSVSIVNSTGKYGLYLNSSTSMLSVTNSTIANGIYLASTGITPTITGNTFSNGDNSPPHAGAALINRILSENTFSGLTATGKIEVVGEYLTQNTLWKKWVAPYIVLGNVYVFKDTVTTATLTIDPGVVVKFNTNTSLQIGSGSSRGSIIADGGTAAITFTSSQGTPTAGSWSGITFSGDSASGSILNNIVVEYGGSGGYYNNANVVFNSSSPVIRNSTIRNSAGSGIYVYGAQNIPQVVGCTVTANKWGVYATSSNPYIVNSRIYGNSTAGVWNSSTTVDVDARNNWWGADSGPTHASNPSGTGNSVSDKVLYNPWIGQTPGTGVTFSNVKVSPAAFNPDGDYLTFGAFISANANWTITITDSGNNVVRIFTGSGTSISQRWFGEDSQSVKVADGNYTYKIEAVNPATLEAASPLQGTVKVFRQLPVAILDVPTDDQIFSGGTIVNVTGTASDPTDFKNYTLEYGAGDNPISWSALRSATVPVQGNLLYAWDLTNATGGVYTLRLTVTDNAGNATVKAARIRLLWIQNANSSETYLSPNGDGTKDSSLLSATASYPVNWSVTLSNSTGTVVRTLTTQGSSAFSQAWDGRNSAGVVVPNDTYTYAFNALDPVSSLGASPKTGTIKVDTTLPTVSITAPVSGGVLQNTATITGTAADTNFDTYTVEYGAASGTGQWTLFASSSMPVTSGTLAVWITNDLKNEIRLENGEYQMKITATDKAGNRAVTAIPVTVNNLILSSISASQNTLNTALGESTTIAFTINSPATVTLSVIPEKLGTNGTPVYQASISCLTAGSYSYTWNGADSTGKTVLDEAYLYILNASDGTRTDGYSPLPPSGQGSITCSQGDYYPRRNVPLPITYSVTQPERVTINILWGSQNFKIVDAIPYTPGTYTTNWDGRNPLNVMLNGGGTASCSVSSLLAENFIIATGNTPKITYVSTDPYQLHFSYGQFTRLKYAVSKQAYITVKMLPPTALGITLVDHVLQPAGEYEIEWKATDATGNGFAVSEEGDYTVWIQATDPVTGASSVTRGNLGVGD
ncbi:repeat-containing protein [Geotalea daltonii FRC-32]|uniref:Repeat-containing protein n=1 Tax=Geotalea daltonii (strain DSM 22248 / JCM 15807 / FRC-32) TaxID=316067 RepID=B9M6Z9_GEODF|nr:right-handed parallel beta-helix repeat-containing protein [Geotalea daltonii]ACM22020.1 repeat-containing protein [Geotalea daltonii FRC-32]